MTAPQRPAVLRIIRKRAKKYAAKLLEIGKDIRVYERSSNIKGQLFDVQGVFERYPKLKTQLLGRHQIINAAVAVGCVESLCCFGVKISREAISSGLRKTHWPGRLQIISNKPRVVLDGAQNRASAYALKNALTKLFKFRNLILVFGASCDKDVRGILKELVPCANRIILTKAQSPRALAPEIMKNLVNVNTKPVILTNASNKALEIARQNARQQDLILVTGSLFLVGDILKKVKDN